MRGNPGKWWQAAAAVLLVGMVSTALAAGAKEYVGQRDTEHSHLTGAWLDTFHNPMDGVTMGLDLRWREIYGRNIVSLNEQQGDGQAAHHNNAWVRGRYRMRWNSKFELASDLDFNMRWIWEFDRWDNSFTKDSSVDFDEIVPDIFNITWRNAFDMPLTLVIGRQDIILGNGWLVLDGTPADGSRTIYFDAARATYAPTEDRSLDIIWIQNYDDEDKWLQPINHRESWRHATQYQDERGLIVYLTDKSLIPNTQVEAYYMYKQDDASDWAKHNAANRVAGRDDEIHTLGGALQGKLDDNWSYRAEGAMQFGSKENATTGRYDTLQAYGFNSRATYAFHDERNSSFHVDYEYLSGDDPGTSANEQFDPLWGEWPQYNRGGDLPAYLWAPEADLGEVTNLHRLGLGYTFDLAPKWTLQTDYNLMWADQNTRGGVTHPALGTTFNSDGKFRGQMLTGYLKYRCCKQLSMHFLMDYFQPGTYYDGSTQDHAVFLRFNFEYTF
ncbi:MAG TPA: hypothetical protein ENN87_02395 [Phycisphaerales bacterium]|nr:hypothetical protein [Phycisphaerales bacterium]